MTPLTGQQYRTSIAALQSELNDTKRLLADLRDKLSTGIKVYKISESTWTEIAEFPNTESAVLVKD